MRPPCLRRLCQSLPGDWPQNTAPAERTASGTWSVKTKAANRVAANAPEVQQYECTTGAAMFWTLFYLSIAGCAIGSVSHWLRKN